MTRGCLAGAGDGRSSSVTDVLAAMETRHHSSSALPHQQHSKLHPIQHHLAESYIWLNPLHK
jgi:hypothetical protein